VKTAIKQDPGAPNLSLQIAQLRKMTVRELRVQYRKVFGRETVTRHKQHLVRRIAWRLQVLTEGDISHRARKLAMEIAARADLRVTVPADVIRAAKAGESLPDEPVIEIAESRLHLIPGSTLTRVYQGRTLTVKVLEDGFEFEGEQFSSLSAVARAATGTRWNGLLFFGLVERKAARVR
jgi:hypothetical protein